MSYRKIAPKTQKSAYAIPTRLIPRAARMIVIDAIRRLTARMNIENHSTHTRPALRSQKLLPALKRQPALPIRLAARTPTPQTIRRTTRRLRRKNRFRQPLPTTKTLLTPQTVTLNNPNTIPANRKMWIASAGPLRIMDLAKTLCMMGLRAGIDRAHGQPPQRSTPTALQPNP